MDTNFLFQFFAQPQLDVGPLIDKTFPEGPARQAARAIVTRLLTDGEMAQYEDGRAGLYLEVDHRPAVQALLDGMPAEDRQRLLELLDGTELSPALEGLILGRWPSRGFLLESRAVFRLPELREHLPADPSQAFIEVFRAVRRILEDRSPESPVPALLNLLVRVERDVPRTPWGNQVEWDEYRARCRSDPLTLALARELSKEFQDTSVALFRALRDPSASYLPRTPGGSRGEGEELNTMDRADIADYGSFLCCVALEILAQDKSLFAPGTSGEITGRAFTGVTRSVIEALLLTFLQRRFPDLVVPVDADLEGEQPQSAEDSERIRQQMSRKLPLFLQVRALFASFHEAARALPPLVVEGELKRTGTLIENMIDALERSLWEWSNLRLLSNRVRTPQHVAPLPTASSVFLHPLPDLTLLSCLEGDKHQSNRPVGYLYITATYCQHNLDTTLISLAGWPEPENSGGASISVHAPDGGACLTAVTYVPVRQFLHPEDPASIVAAYLVRQATWDVQEILALLHFWDVEPQVREAARDVPRLDILHVKRTVRRRVFFWRKRIEHFMALVMRRQDAVRLGIRKRVRTLPPKDQALMREQFGFCPEHPVALRTEIIDDSDGGGGEGPPPPPAPQPRPEQEDVPTSDKVGAAN